MKQRDSLLSQNTIIWALNDVYRRGVASVHKISLNFDNKVSEVVTGNTELEVSEAINRLTGLALR